MKITVIIIILFIIFSYLYFINANNSNFNQIEISNDVPIIKNLIDVKQNTGKIVYVFGRYELQDVRMKQENPKNLFQGHAGIILEDGYCVLLMPPSHQKAIRSKNEQNKCNKKYVYAKGKIYPYVPQEGNTMCTPCLTDISDILPANK
ncbi:MAG: hypothetical protein ACPG5B_11050 [Chitinophagales bacterium]